MEELKPVPPAPKKKPNIFVRLLAFLVTLALLLGAVAAVVYRDRLNFDSIRRWFVYPGGRRSVGMVHCRGAALLLRRR